MQQTNVEMNTVIANGIVDSVQRSLESAAINTEDLQESSIETNTLVDASYHCLLCI